jgi:histidine triad (HIT) family protein
MVNLSKEEMDQIQEYLKSFPENEREAKRNELMAKFENPAPQECPFCLMSENKIPTQKVYENDNFLAVLEINPANVGHTLLIPKKHYKSIAELAQNELNDLMSIIKKLRIALSFISNSVTILVSEGLNSGNRFEHLIINLIPRTEKDSVKINWSKTKMDEKELNIIKEQIVRNIPRDKAPEQPKQNLDPEYLQKEFLKTRKKLP